MAGICIEKIKDENGDSIQIFQNEDGSYSGYNFSKGKYVHDPYKDKPPGYKPKVILKTKAQIQEEIQEIGDYQTVDLPARKLRKQSLEYFGIKIGLSEEDGETPVAHYYPYFKGNELRGYKVRIIEGKKMFSIGDQKDVDLFGWQQAKEAGGRKLVITEGELDCVAYYQMCKQLNAGTKYAEFDPSVVSLSHGAASAARVLAKFASEINRTFEQVVLAFDQDEAGTKATEDCLRIFPDALVADLPCKDLNECLIQGKSRAAYKAIMFQSSKPKNTRLVSVSSVVEKARQEVPWGYSYPYKKLTEMTRGKRLGETYYFGAGVKMGKSELLNDLVAWDIKEHGWKVFVAKPEESNVRTLQGVVGKLVNRIFHDPAVPFDYDAFDLGVERLGDNLVMLDLYQNLNWELLKQDIRAAAADGCKSIYIDPITVLINGINAADANTLLQQIAQELAAMAMDLQIVVHIFCHLKAPESGLPHERGGAVQSYQFAGSRSMMRSCNSMFGIEGNKDPDLSKEERNLRTLVLLEDRMTGNSGKVRLFWDDSTGAFNEL